METEGREQVFAFPFFGFDRRLFVGSIHHGLNVF